MQRTGHISLQQYPFFGGFRIRNRNSGEQRLGIRVPGVVINVIVSGHFHNFTKIHHSSPITDVFNNAQIMRNKDVGKPELFLQRH